MALPKQKVTDKEKRADDGLWYKQCTDHYIDLVNNGVHTDKQDMLILIDALEGEITESTYSYILNPMNKQGGEKVRKYPARMRNYDILTTPLESFLGEKDGEPDNFQVIVTNADTLNKIKEQFDEKIESSLQQDFINNLNKMGLETGIKEQKVEDYTKQKEMFYANANDKRAIIGQEALEYLYYDQDLKDKHQENFRNWLLLDTVFSYKDIYADDVDYRIIDPLKGYPFLSAKSKYVEDGEAFVYWDKWTVSDIIDRFHKELSEYVIEDGTTKINGIDWLEEYAQKYVGSSSVYMTTMSIDKDAQGNEQKKFQDTYVDVYHVVRKTFKKVGILKYIDIFGEEAEMQVDEDYVLSPENGDIEITWEWLNDIVEQYRLGNSTSSGGGKCIYIGGNSIIAQRQSLNNISECKLPYNGLVKRTRKGKIYSMFSRGLIYQILHNILHFQHEKLVNKNKDKLVFVPIGLIPSKPGWDEDKFIYMGETTQFMFYDETKPNALAAINAIKALDMSLGNYMKDMYNQMMLVKEEWYDSIGYSRQRGGDVMASDGKGNTEQAIYRSVVNTREKFRQYNKFEELENQGLLDISKIAWINGKKGQYINSEGRVSFLNITGTDYVESDFGVFAKSNAKETEKLKLMKQYAFSMAQNNQDPEMVAGIIDNDNFSKIKSIVAKAKDAQRNYEAALKQRDETIQKYIADTKLQASQELAGVAKYKVDIDFQKAVEVAKINAKAKLASSTHLNENTDDDIGLDVLDNWIKDIENIYDDADLENQKLEFNKKKHNDTMANAELNRKHTEKLSKEKAKVKSKSTSK